MRQTSYSDQDKQRFWRLLADYEQALKTVKGIVGASLAIHIASGDVPKRWRREIGRAYRETVFVPEVQL